MTLLELQARYMQLGYVVGDLLYDGKEVPPELQEEADEIAEQILKLDPENKLVKI